ncbi:MAG: HTTM domain-containing protein [Proteobacteria bacterium]|nr:HTTM domain-containing protein [Pseudomonadota bacterium]
MSEAIPSLRQLGLRWHAFLTPACDPRPCALIRIGYASLVFVNFAAMAMHVESMWSEQGWLPLEVSRRLTDRYALTVFMLLPANATVLWTCYVAALVQSFLLALGFLSRFNAVCVFVWLVSFQHRNVFITDGEDIVFRMVGFMVIWLPMNLTYALDATLWPAKGAGSAPSSGWALRMLQLEMCLIMLCAGIEKLEGDHWWTGDAMYYVSKLDDLFRRYPPPQALSESLWFLRIMSWSTLAVELLAPLLLWFRETRRVALGAIVALHLGIDYMMNLFLFQWIMLVGWLSHFTWKELVWLCTSPMRLVRVVRSQVPRNA